MSASVPFVDLAAQTAEIAEDVQQGWAAVLASCAYVGGPDVSAFEAEYADFIGVRHCVGVGNGTDALEVALRALGLGPDDEVVVPANTFIATAEAVVRAGCRLVLADVDDETLLLDPRAVEKALTPRTRVVVPVHLYGQAAPVDEIAAAAPGCVVLEDAAQSQGATRFGRMTGSLGRIAGTSFYPGKNLGAFGDAGAVLTDDSDLASRVRVIANHGSPSKYRHDVVGLNSRLDTLQAVVLRAKLQRLAAWNEARRWAAERYAELLQDLDEVRLPRTAEGNEHVWHLYVVRVPRRDEVLATLQQAGIGVGIHYPTPVHLTGAFASTEWPLGAFPVTEAAAGELLSLPMHPHLRPSDQERVADALRLALR